jgi:hypothetical protein
MEALWHETKARLAIQGRIQESKKGAWNGKLRPERKPSRPYANTIC